MKKTILPLILLFLVVNLLSSQVKLGEIVPNFSTVDPAGTSWVMKKQLKESNYLVVYFYPAAFTGGCTKQACSYRDQKGDLEAVGAQVVGISGDNSETLGLFAQEHQLNFSLLADESGEIATIFGVPSGDGGTVSREIQGKTYDLLRGLTIKRWTFILDSKGRMIYKDSEVNAVEDSGKVVEFLSSL